MEDLQKKEAEENTALENMVQQIEANLTITTVGFYKITESNNAVQCL